MRMLSALVALAVLGLATPAYAQLSPDEANAMGGMPVSVPKLPPKQIEALTKQFSKPGGIPGKNGAVMGRMLKVVMAIKAGTPVKAEDLAEMMSYLRANSGKNPALAGILDKLEGSMAAQQDPRVQEEMKQLMKEYEGF